ncbi:hypothetical protein QBC35DRAFT_495405 [Podospora australis]|uniref:NmrA-like domain-containing protein n=1 Tax=Podospora australis TaxID=1536484 RepID=A0AAN7AJW1_9PEZI|nr:hypothetical protein QBC35DRAFT_495405 [Podospora australis]
MSQTVFVTSATGAQGLNVSRQLRAIGWEVHATTRDLSSPAAQELKSLGVHLTQGDWDNEAALKSALENCTALFLCTILTFTDLSKELVQCKRILSLARAAGVKHVVYSSACALAEVEKRIDLHTLGSPIMVASLQSKQDTEAVLREGGFESWTILRGANFMENWLDPKVFMYPGLKETGVFRVAFIPGAKIPLVDTGDIARFAVEAFKDPAKFHEKDINIVSDELSPEDIMAALAAVTNRSELRFEAVSDEQVHAEKDSNPFVTAGLAIRHMSSFMKNEETDSWGIPTTTFKEFLKKNEEAVKKTYLS